MILFALDCAATSKASPATDSIKNVQKFYDVYVGVTGADRFYITGFFYRRCLENVP